MHRCLQICPRTIGTGFTDEKDAPWIIRMGFTDRFLVSHDTREVTERCFLMDESLYKVYLAWLLLIKFLHFDEDTRIFGTLQLSLYLFEAYLVKMFEFFFFFSQ